MVGLRLITLLVTSRLGDERGFLGFILGLSLFPELFLLFNLDLATGVVTFAGDGDIPSHEFI